MEILMLFYSQIKSKKIGENLLMQC